MTDTPVIERVRGLVDPIASDLDLDIYDIEQRGSTVRVTLDTPSGSEAGINLDKLALATRLISRELDHQDPVPGKYTLEVTSPGVERSLRTSAHYRREIGKTINVRLADVDSDERRIEGELIAADADTATVRVTADGADTAADRVFDIASVDRARTVFVWGPKPKPGGKGNKAKRKADKSAKNTNAGIKSKQKESS